MVPMKYGKQQSVHHAATRITLTHTTLTLLIPVALETRGQRSAHSLATGPVIVEPFISPLAFTITAALSVRGDVSVVNEIEDCERL
jgi:hypothetical protein